MAQRLDASGAVKSSDLYNAFGRRLSGGGTGDDPYGFAGMFAAARGVFSELGQAWCCC